MTTLYAEQEGGGISFRSERRIGDVRVPNYVYDMWMPLLGATAMGVYSTYCRLEMKGQVTRITMATLARAFRIGTSKLAEINDSLEECGFVSITRPTGAARLMHWTTSITVKDPPQEVDPALIEKYAPKSGYALLTPWLLETQESSPENPPRFSGDDQMGSPEDPDRTSNIEALDVLKPLRIEYPPPADDPPGTIPPRGDVLDLMARFAGRAPAPSWTVPAAAGGASDWDGAVNAFAAHVGVDPAALPAKKRREWGRVLERVGAAWGAGPKVLEAVIDQIPDSTLSWKTWSAPHQAESDLGTLVGQHLSGGIKRNGGSERTNEEKLAASLARIEARQRVVVVDAEYEVY